MVHKTLSRALLCLCIATPAFAETTWYDPIETADWQIEGQAWPDETTGYSRLPDRAQGVVRDAVWGLSRHSAGLSVRFSSNATSLQVRYSYQGRDAMPHMPATGVSGLDLYRRDAHGTWQWVSGPRRPNAEGILSFNKLQASGTTEYMLMLSPYVAIQSLAIGVDDSNVFNPISPENEAPIVAWGTSITQGACASRPGCMWTNRLRIDMDREVINLGFSGNGQLEPEVATLIAEIPSTAYILDCLPNMAESFDAATTRERLEAAVRIIHQAHPTTPIILVDHAGYGNHAAQPAQHAAATAANQAQLDAIAALRAEGIDTLFHVTNDAIGLLDDTFGTVDGIHPNDIGMMRQANAIETVLREAIHEQKGDISTTHAVTQNREPGSYHWRNRHLAICEDADTRQPSIVMIGDSILHNWGGEPASNRARGQESWNRLFFDRAALNLGCGWDRVENVLWRTHHGAFDNYKADQIVILLGTNNLPIDDSDEAILTGLTQLLEDILSRQPDADILLLGLLPRRGYETRIRTLNSAMSGLEIVAQHDQVTWSDVGGIFLNDDQSLNRNLFTDGVHPSAEGYELLADALAPLLAQSAD